MLRRRVLQFLAISGASALAFEAKGTGTAKTVIYQVKGFSCITCAVGLDTCSARRRASCPANLLILKGK